MCFSPIHTRANLCYQRHFQYPFIHFHHHLRPVFFDYIQFGFRRFQRQFVMLPHNQFACQAV